MQTSKQHPRDTFFLDLEQAYHEAKKQQIIIDCNGKERLQYCYYDGPLTDIILPNFIKIEQSSFVEFFSENNLPIPTLVIHSEGKSTDLEIKSSDIIKDIKNYRNFNKKSFHRDTYFTDRLEALNTAKQHNRISIPTDNDITIQMCYYHGEILDTNFQNLTAIDFQNIIDYFSETTLRIPINLTMNPELASHVKNDLKQSFLTGIKEASERNNEISQQLNSIEITSINIDEIIQLLLTIIIPDKLHNTRLSLAIVQKFVEIGIFISKNENMIVVSKENIFLLSNLSSDIEQRKNKSVLLLNLWYSIKLIQLKKHSLQIEKEYFDILAKYSSTSDLDINFSLIKTLFPEQKFEYYIKQFSTILINHSFWSLSLQKQKEAIYKLFYLSIQKYNRSEIFKNIFYKLYPIYLNAIEKNLDELVFFLHTPLLYSWAGVTQTQQELKYFNDKVEDPLSKFISEHLIAKYKIKVNERKILPEQKTIKIAFLQERIINYSIFKVLLSLLSSLKGDLNTKYELIIYDLNYMELGGSFPATVNELKKIGFNYVDLHKEIVNDTSPFYNIIEKTINIRKRIIEDKIDILIGMHSRPEYNLLFSTRTAPIQIYWSHGNYVYNVPKIDKRILHWRGDEQAITREGYLFHTFIAPYKYLNNPTEKILAIIKKIKSRFPPQTLILGSIGRLSKLNSDEYLDTISKIMQKHSNTVYLACGTGDNVIIKEKIKQLSLSKRFFFEGLIDPDIYGYVIDLYLSPFPQGGGEALQEYKAKGGIYVYLIPKDRLYAHKDIARIIKLDGLLKYQRYLANSIQDYIELTSAIIENRSLRDDLLTKAQKIHDSELLKQKKLPLSFLYAIHKEEHKVELAGQS